VVLAMIRESRLCFMLMSHCSFKRCALTGSLTKVLKGVKCFKLFQFSGLPIIVDSKNEWLFQLGNLSPLIKVSNQFIKLNIRKTARNPKPSSNKNLRAFSVSTEFIA
jgi:hypothetical protein